jgi:hypothetical protein
MPKGEISWKRLGGDGVKCQIYAHQTGDQWSFYVRHRRFDTWELLAEPPLEDWLKLLDGIERRAARRLIRPEEVERVSKRIQALFPGLERD